MDGACLCHLKTHSPLSVGSTEVGAVANVIPGAKRRFLWMTWRYNRDFESAKPGMDYAYFTITPWIETIQMDAGDGKYEIVVLVRVRNHDVAAIVD